VAIARCLVLEPAVLLLDEPLGALDLKLREHMKVELKKLQAEIGTTFVYITHDQSEAMVMSDHVAVMNNGHFEQIDTPSNLYNNPASSFVAMFVGNNNKVTGVLAKDESGKFYVQDKNQLKYAISTIKDCKEGDVVGMYTRPEAIIINPAEDKTFFNRTGVYVKAVLFDGGNSRLLVVTPTGQEVLVALPQNHQFDYIKKGDNIVIGWDPASSVCFKETGAKMYDDEI
jgi:spermidine/putrescine transport system ATP-binding protein